MQVSQVTDTIIMCRRSDGFILYSRRYFMNGCCKEGENCLFSHNWTSKPDMVLCVVVDVFVFNKQRYCMEYVVEPSIKNISV